MSSLEPMQPNLLLPHRSTAAHRASDPGPFQTQDCPAPAGAPVGRRIDQGRAVWQGLWLALLMLSGGVARAQFTVTTVANPNYDPTEVRVSFSQAAGPSALNPANYRIDGQPPSEAAPGGNAAEVVLETPVQTPGRPYTLTILGTVIAASGTPLAGDVNRTWQLDLGIDEHRITGEFWDGVPGTQLSVLSGLPTFPGQPTRSTALPSFEIRPNVGDNYGARVYGLFVPATTGDHQFLMSSDDEGALYLSSDADPSKITPVASEPSWNGSREFISGSNQATRGNPPANISVPIPLTAGQQYYLEARVKEGTGGDSLSVTVQSPGGPSVVNGSLPLPATSFALRNYLHVASGTSFRNFGDISIPGPPAPQSVVEGETVTLRVGADGSPPHEIQWHRNGQPIPGATGTAYTFAASAETAGSHSVTVRNRFSSLTSDAVQVQVQVDATPPVLTHVTGTEARNAIVITFSEPLDPSSSVQLGNYAVDGDLTVSAATLTAPQVLRLTTSRQTEGATYTLQISGVKDDSPSGNPMSPTTATFQGWTLVSGWILHQRWNGAGSLNDLATKRAAGLPDEITLEPTFEYPADGAGEAGSFYVNQLSGIFIPPVTGDYIFYVAGDDQANAYLSTDDDPAHQHLIAREPSWARQRYYFFPDRRDAIHPENRSNTFLDTLWPDGNRITLDAGERYAFSLGHYEGDGGDHVSATYQREGEDLVQDGDAPRFTNESLGFYADPKRLAVAFSSHPKSLDVLVGRHVTLSASAMGHVTAEISDGPLSLTIPPTYQWQVFEPEIDAWMNLPGETRPELSIFTRLLEPVQRYRVMASLGAVQAVSDEATVTVLPDRFPPLLFQAYPSSPSSLQIIFDEPVEKATAQQVNRYELATLGGAILPIVGAALQESGNEVKLTLGAPVTLGTPHVLTVAGIRDLSGNEAGPQTADMMPVLDRPLADAILPTGPVVFLDFNQENSITFPNFGTSSGLGGVHVGPEGPMPHAGYPGAGLPEFGGLGAGNFALGLTGNNRVEVPGGSPLDTATGLTAMALVKAGPMEDRKIYCIVSQEGVLALRWYDWDPSDASVKVELSLINGGFVDGDLPADNEWHLIMGIADGTNLELFVDGRKVGSRLSPILPHYGVGTSPIQVALGNVHSATVEPGTGFIDEVALWNRPLSPSTVSSLSEVATRYPYGNPPEIAAPSSIELKAGGAFEISVALADSDTVTPNVRLRATGNPAGLFPGGLTVQGDGPNRTVSGVAATGASGPGMIVFCASDGRNFAWGRTAVTTVVVNQPPEALDDAFGGLEDQVVSGNVLANDSDPEDGRPTVSNPGVRQTDGGPVTLRSDGSFSFSPDRNFHGTVSFTYEVADLQGATDSAVTTITVTSVNDSPTIQLGPDLQAKQDSGTTTVTGWATGITPGPANEAGQLLTIQTSANPPELLSGNPTLGLDGALAFTPAPGAHGSVAVTVQVLDDGGAENGGANASAPQTFTIHVQRLQADVVVRWLTGSGDLSGDTPGAANIQFENRGEEAASQVQLEVLSEHGITLGCPEGTPCTAISPSILRFNIGSLAPGAQRDFAVPVQASGTGQGPLRVWAHGSTSSRDTDLGNNQAGILLKVLNQPERPVEGVQLSQITFDVKDDPNDKREGGVTLHSEWGMASIRYLPTADVMYFSAIADGVIVANNVPLLHLGAPGDGQPVEKVFTYRIRETPGEPTVTIEWDYRITDDPSLIWIPDPKATAVATRQFCARAGLVGESLLYHRPLGFDPEKVAILEEYAAHEWGFPNQPQGPVECVPAAISNSLNYLNTRFDLALAPSELSIEKMKLASGWDLDYGGAPPRGTRDSTEGWWRDHKAKYMEDHELGIITEDTTDPQVALEALRKGYDVEAEFHGHAAAMVAIGRFKDGRYVIEIAHDLYQDRARSGSQVVEGMILLDPITRQVSGTVWADQLVGFVIERPANVRPQLPGETASTPEDMPANGVIRATDHENDPLTFRIVTAPQRGRLTMDDAGRWTYTPDPNFAGTDSFSVIADDGKTVSRPGVVSITVTAVNDPPEAHPDLAILLEDHDVRGNVIDNEMGPDTDPDGDPLTAARALVKEPEHGTAGVGPNGNFLYNPSPDFHGTDSFIYSVSDGKGGTATATVTVTVTSVNDEPFFVKGGDQTVNSDLGLQTVPGWATLIVPGPANEDGQNVEFLATTDRPDLFSVLPAISPNGTLTYQPRSGADGVATITVRAKDDAGTANDGRDTSEPQNFTITVKPDAPIFLTIGAGPNNELRIHWVDPEARLHLEVTPALDPPSWRPVLEGVESQGIERIFQIRPQEEEGYWRLQVTEPLAPPAQSAAEAVISKLEVKPGAQVWIRGPVPPEAVVEENTAESPRPAVLTLPAREGNYYIVIVDPTPGQKYSHPMRYAWIDLSTMETDQTDGEWPADIVVPNEIPAPYLKIDSTVIDQIDVQQVTGSGAGDEREPIGPVDTAIHVSGTGCKKIALVVDGGDEEAEEKHLADVMADDADAFAGWLSDHQFEVSRRSQSRNHPAPHFPVQGSGPALNLLERIQQIGATEFSCDPDPGCCHEFFLYVGSHGSSTSLSIYDPSGNGDSRLLYYEELFEALAKFPPCVKIVVFIDACYSGVAQNHLPRLCTGRPCGATIVTAVDVSWTAPGGLPYETDSATQDFLEAEARFDGDGDGKVGDFRDRWMHMKSERGNIVPVPATCPGQSGLCSTD